MISPEEKIQELQLLLQEKDKEIDKLKNIIHSGLDQSKSVDSTARGDGLTKEEILRYSRQLILPSFGVEGQKRLRSSSVLIIGAGGLGCPAAIYLAAAGVGRLGIVDYDAVELSNLHRQILHQESAIGHPKAESAARAIRCLNSHVEVIPHVIQLNSGNALKLITDYDVVLDCSDNPATRYLVNDACVLSGKPLISGSALRLEGQLTVYNYKNGPCYRCIYPIPPNPNFVTNCSDGGVLGVVPGLIGTLQAMEAIKLIAALGPCYSQRLLIFDGEYGQFRSVTLRPKQSSCVICGDQSSITNLDDIDYTLFCGRGPTDKVEGLRVLSSEDRVTASEFRMLTEQKGGLYLLIDVRPQLETTICSLPSSVNIPFETLDNHIQDVQSLIQEKLEKTNHPLPVFVVCRRGNNSQLAVNKLKAAFQDLPIFIKDIIGGLEAWADQVDPQFPVY